MRILKTFFQIFGILVLALTFMLIVIASINALIQLPDHFKWYTLIGGISGIALGFAGIFTMVIYIPNTTIAKEFK